MRRRRRSCSLEQASSHGSAIERRIFIVAAGQGAVGPRAVGSAQIHGRNRTSGRCVGVVVWIESVLAAHAAAVRRKADQDAEQWSRSS